VISTQRVMQPGMNRTRIDQMGEGHLVDVPQALVIRMTDDLPDQRVIDGDEPINGVVDDLSDRRHGEERVKASFVRCKTTGCRRKSVDLITLNGAYIKYGNR
jgi:hypothetical protein